MPRMPWPKNLIKNLYHLDALGLAEVDEDHDELPHLGRISKEIGLARSDATRIISVNDKLVYIDTWDYFHPTGTVLAHIDKVDIDIKAIVKIQKRKGSKYENSKNIPVVPWSMFHSRHMEWLENQPEYREQVQANSNKHVPVGYSGRHFNFRKKWFQAIEEIEGHFITTWRKRPTDPIENYIKNMGEWKIGLILKGKSDGQTDGKNRREVEFASVGLPMMLNYQPYYLNELVPGKHYAYVESPDKLGEALSSLTPEFAAELADNAYEWWKENASLEGTCKTFMQAMRETGIL
jgi:hypothetical protein